MESKKLKHTLSKNLAIAALTFATSFDMLTYNVGTSMNWSDKTMPIKTIKEQYAELNKMETIQNAAIGVGALSGLYLIFGVGMPLVNYITKKKHLEEEFFDDCSNRY